MNSYAAHFYTLNTFSEHFVRYSFIHINRLVQYLKPDLGSTNTLYVCNY